MRTRSTILIISVFLLIGSLPIVALVVSLWQRYDLGPSKAHEPTKDFRNYEPMAEGLRKARIVAFYEGLPHQHFEEAALKRELDSKQHVKLHGFPFYAETLELKEGDEKKLTDLFCTPSTFRPTSERGVKLCGGHHPDYCIEWRDGDDVYQVHVCLGCCEIKCYGPVSLHCDIANMEALEALLKPYRKNRPPFKVDGE